MDVAVLAYAAAVALGVLQAVLLGAPGRTLTATVPYLVGLAVVAAGTRVAAGAGGWRDPDRWHRLLAWLCVAVAAWAVARFALALPELGEARGFYRLKVQVTTPLGDHNTAAGLLLVGVAACASLAARDRRWLAGSAVVVLGIVATLSRGAAVILVAVAVLAVVLRLRREVVAVVAGSAVLALAGVLGAAAWLDAAPPPGAPQDGPVGASVVARADLAERGVELLVDHPLTGTGLGSFEAGAADLPPPNDHAHQLLAHAGAEGGVVLLAVAVVVPAVGLRRAWQLPAGSPLRALTLLGGAGLVGHAQLEILGGRLGYELLLAALVAVAGAAVRPTGPPRRVRADHAGPSTGSGAA